MTIEESGLMMRAKLFTADGGYVVTVDVPPFVTGFPKVLIWGERIFTLRDQLQPDGLGVYSETFTYVVPPPLQARRDLPMDMNAGGYDGDAD